MNVLSLFTGAGGGELAFQHLLTGFRTVGYVEYEPYCQAVIRQRISDGLLDDAPIFSDIKDFISEGWAESYKGMVDVVTAGFPCQPFSVAGKRKGKDDSRNLWPETKSVIRMVRPRYAFLENVPGLLASGYMPTIFSDLAEVGYNARWCVLGARDINGPLDGKRVFTLAQANGINGETWVGALKDRPAQIQQRLDTKMLRKMWIQAINRNAGSNNGVADYLDRGTAVGNGQIPIVAATAWEILKP